MAGNFSIWNRKKYTFTGIFYNFLSFTSGTDAFWLATCSRSGLIGWSREMGPIFLPSTFPSLHPLGSALPHCLQHPARVRSAAATRKCWIAAVWELLGSGAVRQGENTGRENTGRRPSGPVGWQELLMVALPSLSDSSALDLPTGTRALHPQHSVSNLQCLPPEEVGENNFISHWFTLGWAFFLLECPSCTCSFQLDVAIGCRMFSRWRATA